MQALSIVYIDSNYKDETTVAVSYEAVGNTYAVCVYDGLELEYTRLVGMRKYDGSCRKEAVEYARRCVIGKSIAGELSPIFI